MKYTYQNNENWYWDESDLFLSFAVIVQQCTPCILTGLTFMNCLIIDVITWWVCFHISSDCVYKLVHEIIKIRIRLPINWSKAKWLDLAFCFVQLFNIGTTKINIKKIAAEQNECPENHSACVIEKAWSNSFMKLI
jgi:hypothetical protein